MEAVVQAFCFCARQIIFLEVLHASFCAPQCNVLLVFATAVVLLKVLIERSAEFAQLAFLNAFVDLAVHPLL